MTDVTENPYLALRDGAQVQVRDSNDEEWKPAIFCAYLPKGTKSKFHVYTSNWRTKEPSSKEAAEHISRYKQCMIVEE